jgi:hypothetical protein
MAARKMTKLHQDDVRSKIQAVHLIKVLSDHALGLIEELAPTRIKAIEILLRKSVADLSAVEVTGAEGGPVRQAIEVMIVDPKA